MTTLIERIKAARDGLPPDSGMAEEHDAFQAAIAALELADKMADVLEKVDIPNWWLTENEYKALTAYRAATKGTENDPAHGGKSHD